MSVVIVGGNECMERQYLDLCKEYRCEGKVFTKMRSGLKSKLGSPDLIVLFTNTVSHKMVYCALSEMKGADTKIVRSHTSSKAALRAILQEHAG